MTTRSQQPTADDTKKFLAQLDEWKRNADASCSMRSIYEEARELAKKRKEQQMAVQA